MSFELLSRYKLVGIIGEGTYGVVYQARKFRPDLTEEPKDYAIKRIKPSSNEIERPSVTSISTLREISLLRELSHVNIVNLTDVVIDPKGRDVAIVMDFAKYTLETVLRDHRRKREKISEFTCKSIMYQCLKGLEYMHENWVLHRDLKPQNILIVGDGENRGRLQLADLGLARVFQSPIVALGDVDKTVVTLWYRAPELLLGTKHYTTAVDVWSLGCIFAELFFAHNPKSPPALFAGKQEKAGAEFERDQCKQVFSVLGVPNSSTWPEVSVLPHYKSLTQLRDESPGQYPPNSQLVQRMTQYSLEHISKAAQSLVTDMLELNPTKRVSARAALEHQYMQSFVMQIPSRSWGNALDDPTNPNSRQRHYTSVPPKPLSPSVRQAQQDALEKMRSTPSQAGLKRQRR